MTTNTKKRIYSFDLLKIISILIVFIYHIVMDMYQIHPMHNLKSVYDIIIRPNMHLAMVACALFILISGATITYNIREEKPLEFYKRRLTRVLIPFYIAYIIYFVIKVITLKNIHIFGGIDKWRFIYTIFGMDEYLNAAGIKTFSLGIGEWFLGCIILCYLAYPFLYKVHKKNNIVTFVVMTIYYILINVFYDKLNTGMPSHFNFLCQVYNFYLGIAFVDIVGAKHCEPAAGADVRSYRTGELREPTAGGDVRSYRTGELREPLWLLVFTIPTILFFYFYETIINIPDNFKTTMVVIAILISFYLFENVLVNNKIIGSLIKIFSSISYEFFLVHHFVIYQVNYVLNYRRLGGVATLAVVALDFLLTIIIAIFVREISARVIKLFKK